MLTLGLRRIVGLGALCGVLAFVSGLQSSPPGLPPCGSTGLEGTSCSNPKNCPNACAAKCDSAQSCAQCCMGFAPNETDYANCLGYCDDVPWE